jgi:hypothetical protein
MKSSTVLFILFLLAGSGAMGQSGHPTMIVHDPFLSPKGVQYPFFDGHYVWWNDSTLTYVSYYDQDSLRSLYKRIDFLMRDDLDTHRRLDSLVIMLSFKGVINRNARMPDTTYSTHP